MFELPDYYKNSGFNDKSEFTFEELVNRVKELNGFIRGDERDTHLLVRLNGYDIHFNKREDGIWYVFAKFLTTPFQSPPFCLVPRERGVVECVSESSTSTLKESPTTSADSENTQT